MYPSGWHYREFEGNFRPPLSPQEWAEKDAKRSARRTVEWGYIFPDLLKGGILGSRIPNILSRKSGHFC